MTKKFSIPEPVYTLVVLKLLKQNTQTQQREAIVQGQNLPPIPDSV
ncbi:MAG: hypothetical protein LBJ00_14315 [Planctomycetaceae bacterium]|nr:hypothetical protein [Planctomycetaceae bacterium]